MNILQGLSTIFGFNKNFNHFGFNIFGDVSFSKLKTTKLLELIIRNPAMVKVLALQCDMFSMGKFYYYENDKEKKMPPEIAELLRRPNYQDNINQVLWDWMFWNMIGNSWLYIRDKAFTPKMFALNSFEMEFPTSVQQQGLILSESTYKEYQKKIVRYTQDNGKVLEIPLEHLIHFKDLTNSPIKDINGFSRVDSLYKVIINNEETLKSQNVNTIFSRKFMVSGEVGAMDVTRRMLTDTEKSDIEKKVEDPNKNIHALKSAIEIRRFVENMKQMELGKQYQDTYFIIGNMYGIPRDVLEAYNSSTYENQEKARSSHVAYCLDPKGQELGKGLSNFFGLKGELVLSWDHLPFVQIMEGDREDTKKKKLDNLEKALQLGVDSEEALAFVDLKFKNFNYEKPRENSGTETPAGEGEQPEAEGINQ